MFDKENSVKNLLSNISSRLLNDGYVIITLPDSYTIAKKLFELGEKDEKNGTITYKNDYFRICCKSNLLPA